MQERAFLRVAGRHDGTRVSCAELGHRAVLQVDQIEERRGCGGEKEENCLVISSFL